jgi:hypothetical protein
MSRLIGLYPASWRARYEDELRGLLADRQPAFRDRVDLVRGALDARLHPELLERGTEDRRVAPIRRASGLLALAGGLTWAYLYASFSLSRGGGIDPSGLWVALFFMATSLIGRDLAAHARSIRRGLAAAATCVVLVYALPWGVNFVPLFALVAIVGAGTLGLAAARSGLSPIGRNAVLVVGFAIPFVLILPVGAAMNWGYGPGPWLQGFIFVPYGIAWMLLGALTAVRGAPNTTNPPSASRPTEANAA